MSAQIQSLSKYPILKHFDTSQIITESGEFKPGQKPIYQVLRLLAVGAVGYFAYMMFNTVLPIAFTYFGHMIGIVGYVIGIMALIVFMPTIFKGMKHASRFLQKYMISIDPFLELETQRKKLEESKVLLQKSKVHIEGIESEMSNKSLQFKKNTEKLQSDIQRLKERSDLIKKKMEEIKSKVQDYKHDDHYIHHEMELMNTLSEANRKIVEMEQSNEFISKYGARSVVMKKVRQKLHRAQFAADDKLADFDLTVKMLRHDFEFAKKAKEGTNAAKQALMIDKAWELEFALETITNTIANDIAITTVNINDINKLTSEYDLTSDELYDKLDNIANNIKIGELKINDPKKYKAEDYIMTQEEKNSTGFGSLF